MSDSPGVSAAYVNSVVSSLQREMERELSRLERQIDRLEREMSELARAVVEAINDQTHTLSRQMGEQTVAMLGGVAATTAMIKSTKDKLEAEFRETQRKLDLQTETELQMEVGKKVADAAASRAKLEAFREDINSRFNKSLELIYQNRVLYNTHFQKIFDEYHNKLKTIGEHIFKLRDADLAPAIQAALVSPQGIHGLPIEVDLYRLKVRAENLDESLSLLKASRLDEVLSSTQRLETLVKERFAVPPGEQTDDAAVCGIGVQSAIGIGLVAGGEALQVVDEPASLAGPKSDLGTYSSEAAVANVQKAFALCQRRPATNDEVVALAQAASRLLKKKLISAEAYVMFEDFLGQGSLHVME
jgi:hypothetical protein